MMKISKLGTAYGGWHIPADTISSDSICYCVGAGEDISFDVELINRFGCHVYTFDPTPRAVAHVHDLIEQSSEGHLVQINNKPDDVYHIDAQLLRNYLHFFPLGIHGENSTMKFYEPSDPTHVSHSTENLQGTNDFFRAECKTLRSFMGELGHSKLDLLKLDIEGAEHSVIDNMIHDGIRPKVLCVEFDAALKLRQFERARRDLQRLVKFGYDIAHFKNWTVMMIERTGRPSVQTHLRMQKLWFRSRRNRRTVTKSAA